MNKKTAAAMTFGGALIGAYFVYQRYYVNDSDECFLQKELKNTYLLVRHGQSTANVAKMIVSNPEIGVPEYGLSDLGQSQAKEAANRVNSMAGAKPIIIFSSDFRRTKETAEFIRDGLRLSPEKLILTISIRERYFGDLDLKGSENYRRVWDEDASNSRHTKFNVESVHSVASRVQKFIMQLESEYEGYCIILVGHGDTLQISQTCFQHIAHHLHRSLPHLGNCDVRLANQSTSS